MTAIVAAKIAHHFQSKSLDGDYSTHLRRNLRTTWHWDASLEGEKISADVHDFPCDVILNLATRDSLRAFIPALNVYTCQFDFLIVLTKLEM